MENMAAYEKMVDTRTKLVLDHHFFAAIALRMKLQEDSSCCAMWIDGKSIGYNPTWVMETAQSLVLGVMAHETMHVAMCHPARKGNREHPLCNKAGDYVVNALIKKDTKLRIPEEMLYDVRFEGMCMEEVYAILYKEREDERNKQKEEEQKQKQEQEEGQSGENGQDEEQEDGDEEDGDEEGQPDNADSDSNEEPDQSDATSGEDENEETEDAEDGDGKSDSEGQGEESDDEAGDESGSGKGSGNGTQDGTTDGQDGTGFGQTEPEPWEVGEVRDYPGQDGGEATEAELAQAEQEAKIMVIQAAMVAKAFGNLPGGIARLVEEIKTPSIDYRERLRQFADMVCQNDYSYRKPNPRYGGSGIIRPTLYNEEVGPVVVAVDTSGSIDDGILAQFSGELNGVLEAMGADCYVLYIDTAVRRVDVFTQDDLPIKLEAVGGGGTCFRPAFEWVDRALEDGTLDKPPCCLIYLTDLRGRFPETAPDYPVLWAVIENPWWRLQVPFGEMVSVKYQWNESQP